MKKIIKQCLVVIGACLVFSTTLQAEELGKELMSNVMKNDVKAVAKLLDKKADVDYQDPTYGSTPLIMACNYGFKDVAVLLLENGADVNLQAKNGATALIGAAGNSKALVELLLEKGAKLKVDSSVLIGPFTSSIIRALSDGPTDIAELLLEKGADVNESTSEGKMAGYTPLMMAVSRENLKVVKFLVENGADINARAADGTTAMSKAEKAKAKDIVKYLKKAAKKAKKKKK